MNSWDRVQAYAKQRGQDPYRSVNLTSKQSRRYVKKWHWEFRNRSVFAPTQMPDGRDLAGQGVGVVKLMTMEKIKVTGEWV